MHLVFKSIIFFGGSRTTEKSVFFPDIDITDQVKKPKQSSLASYKCAADTLT